MQISVQHGFRPKRGSLRCAAVMDSFGIGFERGAHVIAEGLEVPVRAGSIVLFTGASGSGKSSLMRAAMEGLRRETRADGLSPSVVDINALELGETTLIDSFTLPVSETMHLLSSCGLGEAHLMLRTPAELSDGQRYRFRLALGLSARPEWLAADEFSATLDRTLAHVVAHNIRKLCDRTGTGFLLATTHEDVAADLDPDVHVRCRIRWRDHGRAARAARRRRTESAVRGAAKKKSAVVWRGAVDQQRVQARLAVLRSVALPQPSRRADAVRDAVVARHRSGGHLPVRRAADLTGRAESVFWKFGTVGADVDPGDEPAARDAQPGRAAADVSRRGGGGGVHSPQLRAVGLPVD